MTVTATGGGSEPSAQGLLKPISEALNRSPENLLGLVILVNVDVEGVELSLPYEIISWNSFSCNYVAKPCRDKDYEMYGELQFEDIMVNAFEKDTFEAIYVNEGGQWEEADVLRVAGGAFAGVVRDKSGAAVLQSSQMERFALTKSQSAQRTSDSLEKVHEVADVEESSRVDGHGHSIRDAFSASVPQSVDQGGTEQQIESSVDATTELALEVALSMSEDAESSEVPEAAARLECAGVIEFLVTAAIAEARSLRSSVNPCVDVVAAVVDAVDAIQPELSNAPPLDSRDNVEQLQLVGDGVTTLASIDKFDSSDSSSGGTFVNILDDKEVVVVGVAQDIGATPVAQSDDGVDSLELPEPALTHRHRRKSGCELFAIPEEELDRVARLEGDAARARIEAEAAAALKAAEEERRAREEQQQRKQIKEEEEVCKSTLSDDYFVDESGPIAERASSADTAIDDLRHEETDQRPSIDELDHSSQIHAGFHSLQNEEGLIISADMNQGMRGSFLDYKRASFESDELKAVMTIVNAQTAHVHMHRGVAVMNQTRPTEVEKMQTIVSLQRDGSSQDATQAVTQGEKRPSTGPLPELKVTSPKKVVIDMVLATRDELLRVTPMDCLLEEPVVGLDSSVALLDSFLDMESSHPMSWDLFASMVGSTTSSQTSSSRRSPVPRVVNESRRVVMNTSPAARSTHGLNYVNKNNTRDEETHMPRRLVPTTVNEVRSLALAC